MCESDMSIHISRRDFLKLASLLPLALPSLSASNPTRRNRQINSHSPNVLIVVFDTLSALHLSLYGFHRKTAANLARFAENATVYHAHYSAGNFTSPGTASILTGTTPFTHRAINMLGSVEQSFISRNIFSQFNDYTRIGFSHNHLTNLLLYQFQAHIDEFIFPDEIAIVDYNFADDLFRNDFSIASQVERRYLKKPGETSNSLFLHPLLLGLKKFVDRYMLKELKESFPRGIPGFHDMIYPLEDTIDWIIKRLMTWPQPFMAYLHMMPPHDPYCPRKEFVDIFQDGWEPINKPEHTLSNTFFPPNVINAQRMYYDEYIAYVDAEFGRLHDFMQQNNCYDNTIVIFTSDHGEMFERKIFRHVTATLFQPIIRVPLLISLPHQTSRQDIYTPTSCIDLLPTLLHLTGHPIPTWCEGMVLPPYATQESTNEHSIFALEAKENQKMMPLKRATVAMIKGDYKMIYYRGYEGYDGVFELYNLHDDPEELDNLYTTLPVIASELERELLAKIEEKDKPLTTSN